MTTKNLLRAKARWDKARTATKLERSELHAAIREASDAGLSQADIARALGWPRQRVNTLLAKES